jgi:hypothetical protein
MVHHIGKKIQLISLILACVLFALFFAFGLICLIKALGADVDGALRAAGLQAAGICLIACILTPLAMLNPYGFGHLIVLSEKRAEDIHETKELLRKALGEGLLADDIARQLGTAITDKLQVITAAPVVPSSAPLQRPVTEPSNEESTKTVQESPRQKNKKSPEAKPAIRPLHPVGGNEEQF